MEDVSKGDKRMNDEKPDINPDDKILFGFFLLSKSINNLSRNILFLGIGLLCVLFILGVR